MRYLLGTVILVLVLLAGGCAGLDRTAPDDAGSSEVWQTELRKARSQDVSFGGVSSTANQIERNLGVR